VKLSDLPNITNFIAPGNKDTKHITSRQINKWLPWKMSPALATRLLLQLGRKKCYKITDGQSGGQYVLSGPTSQSIIADQLIKFEVKYDHFVGDMDTVAQILVEYLGRKRGQALPIYGK
jgi:hypothetical protein